MENRSVVEEDAYYAVVTVQQQLNVKLAVNEHPLVPAFAVGIPRQAIAKRHEHLVRRVL
ncbi:MAG: hypothetical protein ACLGHQ_10230 [Acidimicrobiia bacterium]